MRWNNNALAYFACLALMAASPLQAQKGIPTPCDQAAEGLQGRNHPICKQKRGFNLLGLADNAVAGLRTVGDVTFAVASSTPGDSRAIGNVPVYMKGTINSPTSNLGAFFEYHFWQAAGRGDYFKARDTIGIESLQNVRGGGFAFATNSGNYGGPDLFTGHDGSLGSLYEGANSGAGSCRDMSFAFIPAGRKLLSISECPETWPKDANGTPLWRGSPYLSEQSFLDYQNAVGKPNFRFDSWQVPKLYADPERQFIGSSSQTFAIASDHGRENRAAYGNVITPGGPDPKYEGYPLGLDYEWDAMTFNVSSVARMMVLEARIINNSEEVYGKGIDYDSLFVGFQTRWLHAPPGLGRRASPHSVPQYGAVVANELGRTQNCDNARWPTGAFFTCSAVNGRTGRGFLVGATGIMYLKSPIGDLRNKKLSDPASPFYNPSSPLVADTITFNRMSMCGFECANVQFVDMNSGTGTARRAYGTVAAREREALGTRAPTDLTDLDYFYLFKPKSGFETRVDLTNPRAGGGFNYCVPGNWKYSNRPTNAPPMAGQMDTLFLDDCNPQTNTLTALWSDTLPDRSMNMAYNNTWTGAGPFPLAAGDTTGLTIAIIQAPDSAQFMLLLQSAYDFYQDFYLGPGAPVPAAIQYAEADSGIAGLAQNRVVLRLDYTQVNREDPSIPKTLAKFNAAPPGTNEYRLRQLNPWLSDSIALKAPLLVDTMFIFKSCNGGRTFTATRTRGACITDRALSPTGAPIGTGWRAYATLTRDASGNFPSTYTDAFVTGGQKYLYSIVAHRAALEFTVTDSGVVEGQPTLVRRTYTVLEASMSPLTSNTSAPNVVEIYVPVSAQLGATGPVVQRTIVGPTGSLAIDTAYVLPTGSFETPLNYTTYFGDSVKIVRRDYPGRGGPDSTYITLYRNARTGFNVGNTPIRTFRDSLVFATNQLLGVFGGTYGADSVRTAELAGAVGDSLITTTYRARQLVTVVAETATQRPFFVSASLTSSSVPFQPAEALSYPGAPPLIFTISNRLVGSGLVTRFWREPGFSRVRAVGTPTITLDPATSSTTLTGIGWGEYVFEFRGDEFGPGAPFTVSLTNPATTGAQYAQSMIDRVRADSTRVDQATVDIINASLNTTYTTDDLVKLYVPFVTTNIGRNPNGNRVTLAALKSSVIDSAKLGSAGDTIRVDVPDGIWVPGIPLIFIEHVPIARTEGGVPVTVNGELQMDSVQRVTFSRATLSCSTPQDGPNQPRLTCNPVRGLGATGHVRVRAQQELHARFDAPFTSESEIRFVVQPPVVGMTAARPTSRDLDRVLVVPNPYIFQTSYEQGLGVNERRLLFTHVPPQGRIRIFTASGAFVQEFSWTPDMLGTSGDIFWNMRTRENIEVGPGLYLFTVEATGPNSGGAKRKRPGKFIIIK